MTAGGLEIGEAYERFAGRRPVDQRALKRDRADEAARERARVFEHPAGRRHPELAAVLRASRILAGDADAWMQALDVVGALPADPRVERAVVSARTFGGDAHVLDQDTNVERFARATLERLDGGPPGSRPARAVWAAWGVETDPLSSTVLTLNLAARGESSLARALAAFRGGHAVLTLAQLELEAVRWDAAAVYVCENPSVVRVAETRLGGACRPLVSTGGWPSAAVSALLTQLKQAGAILHHHGDFDWDGVAIHHALVRDHGVLPWRFGPEDYDDAVQAAPQPLRRLGPRRRATPGPIGSALERAGCQVPEELVLDALLADLSVRDHRDHARAGVGAGGDTVSPSPGDVHRP